MLHSLRRIGKGIKDRVKIRVEHLKLTKAKLDLLNDMNKRIENTETEEERKKAIKEKEKFLDGIEEAKAREQAKYDYLKKKQD